MAPSVIARSRVPRRPRSARARRSATDGARKKRIAIGATPMMSAGRKAPAAGTTPNSSAPAIPTSRAPSSAGTSPTSTPSLPSSTRSWPMDVPRADSSRSAGRRASRITRQPRISTAAATPIGPAMIITITPCVDASWARASAISGARSASNFTLRMPSPWAEVPTGCETDVSRLRAATVGAAVSASIRSVSTGYQVSVFASPEKTPM